MAERAYFTPTREELFEIQRNLLNNPGTLSISFNTAAEGNYVPDKKPKLEEHKMKVEKVSTYAGGYAIEGTVRGGVDDGASCSVEVDTTVEPPVAMYSTD